jgi:hypothetical protein
MKIRYFFTRIIVQLIEAVICRKALKKIKYVLYKRTPEKTKNSKEKKVNYLKPLLLQQFRGFRW